MPRPAKGARVWFDKAAGYWFIRDGAIKRSTGCGLGDRKGADTALATYIAEKYEAPRDSRSDRLLVADVLTYYGREVARSQKSKASGYAIAALLKWWVDKPLSEVRRSTCQAYVVDRMSKPIGQAKTDKAKERRVRMETPRRELAVLRAAINAFHKETPLDALPVVSLPESAPPRTRWLSRTEVAKLLWACRTMADQDAGQALARFIVLGVYTGTRSGALRRLGWMPNTLGGWIDLKAGVIHRRGEDEAESKKRRPSARIPDRIAGSLDRWKARDLNPAPPQDRKRPTPPNSFVVHYRNQPIDKQRKSWAEACARAGLGSDVTPHILRHTAVTWMMLAGNDPYDVAAYVGMSVKMLDDVYGHHHPDHQRKLASRIGRR